MRTVIDLDGLWDFVADLDPKYHEAQGGFARPDADRRHWRAVPVPGVWQKYGERYDIYEGVCWFARPFTVPATGGPVMARLRFGGVNYLARVFVNGEHAGTHEGGYTEFAVDVSDQIRPGANHLAVQVDNRALRIRWPPVLGYFNYGGIHRGVRLELDTGPALAPVELRSERGRDQWYLRVGGRVRRHGPEPVAGLQVRVRVGGGAAWGSVSQEGRFDLFCAAGAVAPWTPWQPHLEPVAVELLDAAELVVDRRDVLFGFRELAVRDGRVELNGRPCPLQGVCYVFDSPVSGLTMTPEQIDVDVRLMKAAGCNAVRCHYPMDEAFYSACDRLGLLVWIEPPVYCYHPADAQAGTAFADPEWLDLAKATAREMIAVARNHPCVAIYGIGNECNTRHPEAAAFFAALAGAVRQWDPTRLVSYAALYGTVGPVADLVDLVGVNSYYGWYDQIRQDGTDQRAALAEAGRPPAGGAVSRRPIDLGPLRRMLDGVLAEKAGLALLLTEFGADSAPGYRSSSRELWSEEYHADLLRATFALVREYPQIAGTFPFCLADYRDPSKIPNGYWNELNLKGLVDYRRRPKLAYAAVQEAYSPLAEDGAGMPVPRRQAGGAKQGTHG